MINGIPEGYRLGEVAYLREDRKNITFELIPIEQPKQLEAVIVVPISGAGYMSLEKAIERGPWHKTMADSLANHFPDRVTIREREKGNR